MEGKPFTIEIFKTKWLGLGKCRFTLMHVIRSHNNDVEQLIGREYVKATWVKYKTTEKHVEDFIHWKYHVSDLNLRSIKYEFVTDFYAIL
jgi:hypothetical protein